MSDAPYTDRSALLAAIVAQPEDDALRLVYADALQEAGEDDRAEFVRVQCELARMKEPNYPEWLKTNQQERNKWRAFLKVHTAYHKKLKPLCARESALRAAHESAWRAGPVCGRCGGKGERRRDYSSGKRSINAVCHDCHATGDGGGLLRWDANMNDASTHTWYYRVDFVRGFVHRVHCTLAECVAEERVECAACDGRGIVPRNLFNPGTNPPSHATCGQCNALGYTTRTVPSPWLRSVLTATPERALVREVVCSDAVPHEFPGHSRPFSWCRASNDDDPPYYGAARIPYPIFDLMPDTMPSSAWRYFPTREAAVTALARALALWGRSA
jgi:uncharacterized protein (TIGR02996 family)